ncbi:MAG TPA: hypothetical protein VFR58_09120 [Flavisolibacter sp.]|nr:hypothetical protein [Flavisolibacter sp.]
MFKRSLLLGVVSGILAGLVSLAYQKVYASSLGYDFSEIVKPYNILATCVFAGIAAAVGFWALTSWLKGRGEIVFNFLLVILTFATILGPFAMKLPLEIEAPELFPGMVVPMHFFPALAWFTLKPLFFKPPQQQKVFA